MFNTTVDELDTRDARTIDWGPYQARAVIPFELDDEGRPVNPVQPDLPEGQGQLWHHAEAVAADAIVIWTDVTGARRILVVDRDDAHGFGLPGGMLDEGETAEAAVVRELEEETGLKLDPTDFSMLEGRYVPDPRAARGAWMVTIPGVATIHSETMPLVAGADDARQALWLPATTYAALDAAVRARGGQVFAAHVAMLRDVLG